MNLEDIRREYTLTGLDRKNLDENPMTQFEAWMNQAIAANLNSDPTAMTIATVDAEGQPTQRVVLLKQFDEQGFVFYTNLESQKAQDINQNNKVSLHLGWLPLERQVRVVGVAEKVSVEQATQYFQSRPYSSQLGAWASHQSEPIESRAALEEAFERMKSTYKEGDVPLPPFWGGYRIKPLKMEFWQGRSSRLHDRLVYQLNDKKWSIDRLQP